MKQYTFMGGNRQPIVVYYTEFGRIPKIIVGSKEYTEVKLTSKPGEKNDYMTEEFIPFIPWEWEKFMAERGCGQLRFMADDGYYFSVYPVNAPVCKQCGIFPVFEHRGFNQHGVEFTQGWSKKCTGCDETRQGLEEGGIATGDSVGMVYHSNLNDMADQIIGLMKSIIQDNDKEGESK